VYQVVNTSPAANLAGAGVGVGCTASAQRTDGKERKNAAAAAVDEGKGFVAVHHPSGL
jgi:hypothetical protein